MNPLEKQLRSKLENTIQEARDIAEAGAQAALQQLGVGQREADAHLSEAEKDLRRRLRAHGRQLGDVRKPDGTQELARLTEEVAYEHWHRMLFARFLAENDLLMFDEQIVEGETRRRGDTENAASPRHPVSASEAVAISLEEADELAPEYGCKNAWEFAALLATRMLPQIFRPDSPSFELELPPEYQRKLENLLAGLAVEVFQASDALGWVYQFWQAKRKDEVNASEVKIGARELPAVTQLFTEPYMVSFLLDNSLGAWWATRCDAGIATASGGAGEGEKGRIAKAKGIFSRAESEQEIRDACALPGVPLEYLRFVRVDGDAAKRGHGDTENSASPLLPVSPSQKWLPAAGIFTGWPEQLAELKTLDPCCGSGHFLVAAFLMLVPMRMEREGLSARDAVDAVLRDNLHGLEIDPRCVEIAAFALALTAWRFPEAGGYRPLPELQVACSGLSISVAKEEWKQLPLKKQELRLAMDWLYDTFAKAPVLGSLIDPSKSDAAKIAQWQDLQIALQDSLAEEHSDNQRELGIVAQGLTKAAELLSSKYHYILTNVPYLARGKQDEVLRDFCEKHPGKNDLATVFLDRCLQFCHEGGTTNVVLPQNWLFLTSYRKFREKLLQEETWNLVARMGEGGFQSSAAAGAFTILLTISRGNWTEFTLGEDSQSEHPLRGLDVSAPRTAAEKATQLLTTEIKSVEQAKQLDNPDARVALDEGEDLPTLEKYADGLVGLQTSDDPMFITGFWEHETVNKQVWEYLQGTPSELKSDAGSSWLVRWEQGKGLLLSLPTSYPTKGLKALGKEGVAIHRMRVLYPFSYTKERFHQNVAVIIPYNPAHLPAIWCFCSSPEYNEAVRRIDQKLNVTNATLVKVPFDLERWTKVAEEKYPNGLPKPYSDDPTQWIFHGHPVGSDDPLQVAVARLLGYQWPTFWEWEKRRAGDGEQDDAEKGRRGDAENGMELSDEAWEKVELAASLNDLADEDGIVCIPPVRGEASAADRLLNLLERAYSHSPRPPLSASPHLPVSPSPAPPVPASFSAWVQQLLSNAEHSGKTLEGWLRDRFFVQHCKRFQHRPFIWHIWDGLRDGFAALVNYHKFDAKALETLIYTYLGDWISRCERDDRESGRRGEGEKTAAAKYLKERLEKIAEGEPPYDIFVRWKPLSEQPIGWNPDLNDGVRLNIRPFMTGPDLKKRGAGILREKPNIHWKKDRGKDVESAPWFHLFQGERINDHHLTREEKEAARKEKEK